MTKSKGIGRGGVRKGAGRVPQAAKVDWNAVAREYYAGTVSIDDLLPRHGLTYGMLLAYAAEHQWEPRPAKRNADDVGEMASELASRMVELDGVTNRAKRFVAAMSALGVDPEHIAPILGITERSLRADFAKQLSGARG